LQAKFAFLEAPFGQVHVVMAEGRLVRVVVIEEEWDDLYTGWPGTLSKDERMCRQAVEEISEYFQGKRTSFSLPLLFGGTAFQKKVWRAIQKIPYGHTAGYGEIARWVRVPGGARAVGQASRRNFLPLVIPCHRVLGWKGGLVGYGGQHTGIKAWLLDHEKTVLSKRGG